MRILLLASAFNSLSQRVFTELRARNHVVGVELALSDSIIRAGVTRFQPELIIAPMLTTAVPEDIWRTRPVLIVHPGPLGDRGPSSLDWAITIGAREWGVTVLQAVAEMDAGPVWATVPFPVTACGKSELYRTEVADAAVEAVLLAVARFASGIFRPRPLDYTEPDIRGQERPYFSQDRRQLDWQTQPTRDILRTLHAADSQPGVLDELCGRQFYLHGAHPEDRLRGTPGAVIATREGAICRATVDGAVWLTQLRERSPGRRAFKRAAAEVIELSQVPEVKVSPTEAASRKTFTHVRYFERDNVGYLEFSFRGGAMNTAACEQLLAAYLQAREQAVDVIVLGGPRDFFSNGIDLNTIEAANDPAMESLRNISAMNDLVEAILTTTDKLVISALAGNAAAGGVMLAIAADEVWCREAVVLNPHYVLMGLYGSEYWTYSLPRRVGHATAKRLTSQPLPLNARAAAALGLVDRVIAGDAAGFSARVHRDATILARDPDLTTRLVEKKRRLAADQADKPLRVYRAEEMARMRENFFGTRSTYHDLRRKFVYGEKPIATPAYLRG
ncbi:hydrogenase maturation protein [Nocardia camponoti]|uniref:Hydrogenase maturation factor HoxX n=1 Tax=Nocardia camponoti TaxID=1616106 RepID=A0A917QCM7_9NOCA|nr:hydrogenase maturation protein [Nocardia camponoti]GGK44218.1 hydrogenase maturation factor HoxX [Nocardia camponoti]